MARSQTAYLLRDDVPTRAALQKAIDGLKFKLTLDNSYVPFQTSGYLPCTLDGEDAGFDIRFQAVADWRAKCRDCLSLERRCARTSQRRDCLRGPRCEFRRSCA